MGDKWKLTVCVIAETSAKCAVSYADMPESQDRECTETRLHSPFTFRPPGHWHTKAQVICYVTHVTKMTSAQGIRKQKHLRRQCTGFVLGIR